MTKMKKKKEKQQIAVAASELKKHDTVPVCKYSPMSAETWAEIILKSGEERRKATNEYWRNAKDTDLPCTNATYKEVRKRITCKLTKKNCVCSYMSSVLLGAAMAYAYVDCPAFKRRHRKRKPIPVAALDM